MASRRTSSSEKPTEAEAGSESSTQSQATDTAKTVTKTKPKADPKTEANDAPKSTPATVSKPAEQDNETAPEGPADSSGVTVAEQPGTAAHKLAVIRHDPDEIRRIFETGEYPYKKKMSRKVYEKHKAELQVELLKVQEWVRESGEKVVLLFEGRDAAGKGGTIKRFMEHLNPRGARVVALDKPSDRERKQWFFQHYIQNFPAGGEIVLFDRSWYNRAGVERVMNFCTANEYLEFMRQAPELEPCREHSELSGLGNMPFVRFS